jgi:hypothetical protein
MNSMRCMRASFMFRSYIQVMWHVTESVGNYSIVKQFFKWCDKQCVEMQAVVVSAWRMSCAAFYLLHCVGEAVMEI